VSLDGSTLQSKPGIIVRSSDELSTVIEFDLNGFVEEEITEDTRIFKKLRLPDYYTTLEIGRPQLPAITEMVAIPGIANVRATVIDSTVEILKDYDVYPFQTPLLEDEVKSKFDIDNDSYSRDTFYPASVVELKQPAIWRSLRVSPLRCYPVRYNPVTKELMVYRSLVVKLEYYGTSSINTLDTEPTVLSKGEDEMYRGNVLNYDFLNLPVTEKGYCRG